jgi:hypothetical protein
MEAMAAGVALIATDSGGQREILDHGRWGQLVPPGDPDALAQAIQEALNDWPAWQNRAQAAREHALAHLDLDTYVDDYLENLSRIIEARPGRPVRPQSALPSHEEIEYWSETLGEAALHEARQLTVEHDPERAWRLGVALKRTGHLDVAESIFTHLNDTYADNPTHVRRASFHLAEIALCHEDWLVAADLLRACLRVAPDHAKATHNLAAALDCTLPPHLEGLRRAVEMSRV